MSTQQVKQQVERPLKINNRYAKLHPRKVGIRLQRCHKLVPLGRCSLAPEDLQEQSAARAGHRLLGARSESGDVSRSDAGLDEQGDAQFLGGESVELVQVPGEVVMRLVDGIGKDVLCR